MRYAVYYRPDGSVIETSPVGDSYDIDEAARKKGPNILAIRLDRVPPITRGKKHKFENGQVILVDDPDQIARENRRKALRRRVQLQLALSDEEMTLLFGG